jgi:hypothetical protein
MKFTQADETQIRQVRLAIRVALRQFHEPGQVLGNTQGRPYQSLAYRSQHQNRVPQVKCGFGENRFSRQERLANLPANAAGPFVVGVVAIRESDQETGAGDRPHLRENPLRPDRSAGPATAPASRMNGFS